MAFGTVFRSFARSGAEFHVALDALMVKRIGLLGNFGALHVGFIMALQATIGNLVLFKIGRVALLTADQGFFITWGMVMTIETIQRNPAGGRVGLVVEKNLAGVCVVLNADGLFRRFYRKGGIAYNGNQ